MKITGLFDSHNSSTASPYIVPSDCGQLFNVCSILGTGHKVQGGGVGWKKLRVGHQFFRH